GQASRTCSLHTGQLAVVTRDGRVLVEPDLPAKSRGAQRIEQRRPDAVAPLQSFANLERIRLSRALGQSSETLARGATELLDDAAPAGDKPAPVEPQSCDRVQGTILIQKLWLTPIDTARIQD